MRDQPRPVGGGAVWNRAVLSGLLVSASVLCRMIPPVEVDEVPARALLCGAAVLVTGAGGSVGAELCRQIARLSPARLILVDRAEDNLFRIHRDLPDAEPCIGDVCDRARMEELFYLHRPAVVLHAAAYKHVPMMERCPAEAVRNNVVGTRIVADAALLFGARSFTLVSTDKAVNPASVMGASKRLAERYVRALGGRSATRFLVVRFGNVLGSTGSVVPIFLEQIASGGPVTVTHPEMMRYFMTIPEACQLVLQATALSSGGETFVLDMGQPLRIFDLARELIRRSGRDIQIVFTGPRPGEKLVEELSHEGLFPSAHLGILVSHPAPEPVEDVVRDINGLCSAADVGRRLLEAS